MNRINILLICIIASICCGCKDLLTLTPEDTLSPTSFFTNRSDLELWTNQFYSQFDDADDLAGLNADDQVDNTLGALMLGQRDAADENGWSWSMLRKINYYLQNSVNCTDADARQEYDGLAYFMRAYFYFVKVRRYGDVPWYDQVLGSADDALLFKPRDDRGLVMDSVMADLDRAFSMLPKTRSAVQVTKWTALALKTRIALYEGTFRKYHGLGNADKYLQQVVTAGDEFMNNSGYTLYNTGENPYRELFISDGAKSEEVILSRVYSASVNLMHGIQFNILNTKQGFTRRFMNHYLMSDGTRFTDQANWETKFYTEEVTHRDPRLEQTVLCPGYKQKGSNTVTKNQLNAVTGYQPIKFVSAAAYDGATKGVSDFPLFRTAEVYLNYAEAKAELGTLAQSDVNRTINNIRKRANMPDLVLSEANANPDPLLLTYYPNITSGNMRGALLEIRRERTVELALEGFRQWDLLRWKEGKQFTVPFYGCYFPGPGKYDMDADGKEDLVLWKGEKETLADGVSKQIGVDIILSEGDKGYVTAYPTFSVTWNEDRDYLWPIPASERVLSGGILTQNPGWTDSTGY